MSRSAGQREQARALLAGSGMARHSELRDAGVTAATLSRMTRDGEVVRLSRGLYQLPDAELDAHHSLAEAAKRVPKGVVCLTSALTFHGLTDQLPARVWLAIGNKDWLPKVDQPPLRIVRFTPALLAKGVETHIIEGVSVRIFGIAKTVADCFRHRRTVGLSVALEGLQEALRQRKATPAEIASQAERGGIATVIRPYLEALTANG
jgi:predicted transcriptional regulator of viral defense system